MAFDIQFKLIYQGIRDVFRVRSLSMKYLNKGKALTGDEIKKRELAILLAFQEFCQSYGLRFYLAGGTLLGAIRHHGFIPWDDDIDVCMPRDDYEKLLQAYPKEGQYLLRTPALRNLSHRMECAA